jgi:hypothetical protein
MGPMIAAPPGVNLADDHGNQMNIVNWLLTSLSAVFVALRLYCKFLKHRGLWYDDHVLIMSWVSAFSSTLTRP